MSSEANQPPRILVVEDERVAALDIRSRLESFGYVVADLVSTGEEALAAALTHRPDLVIMDVKLKGPLDGIGAADRIRAELDIPVIYLTAYSDNPTLQRARVTEPFGFLLKPFDERELYTTIEMALYKHKMERKLKEHERWLSTILESISDAVIATDAQGLVSFFNPVAEDLTGWKRHEAIGRRVSEVLVVDDGAEGHGERAEQGRSASSRRTLLTTLEGAVVPIEYSVAPFREEGKEASGRVFAFRDVTAQAQAEEELHASRQRLQELARHLQTVREEERKMLAREIHDELGQTLSALRLDLARLSERLPDDRRELGKLIRSSSSLLDRSVQTVRTIIAELRPNVLDDLGLTAAIRWQARNFRQRTGIECDLGLALQDEDLDPDLSTTVFRIVQESLTNVMRHANARRVEVSLCERDDLLHLEVIDDGRGISDDEVTSNASFGLTGIRERVGRWGGRVRVRGTPGKGTRLVVELPLQRVAEDGDA